MFANDLAIDLENYMEYSEMIDVVYEKSDMKSELMELIRQRKEGFNGDKLLWDERLKFRKGELTLWAGVNGHGKSLVLGQVVLDLLHQGRKVMIASLEMPGEYTLDRMARQFTWSQFPTEREIDQFMNWRQDHLYIFNFVGSINRQKVIALCRYAKSIGCDHIVIDSLMKCTGDDDDYGVQKGIVNDLCEVAKEVGIHIHLVHHARKGQDTTKRINKYDIKGSGAICDLAHNIVLIHRNLEKEESTKINLLPDNTIPDQFVELDKQRNGEIQKFDVGLWFDRKSQSYTTDFGVMPQRYADAN